MKRLCLILVLLLLPLLVGNPFAETVSWTPPMTWSDGATVSASDKATFTYYIRIWRDGSPATNYYLGETRNGATTWTDNVMVKANAANPTLGLKAGDVIWVDVSTAYKDPTSGTELDSWPDRKGAPVKWTIPGAVVPPPPKPIPGCNPPTGVTIK